MGAWGEERLIAEIRGWLGAVSPPAPYGIGADCAVVPPSAQPQLLKVDPVIYRRHFDDDVAPRAVGEKLLKRNLSDIAAMGGRPISALVALTLDARTRQAWVEQFYRGLAGCARRYHLTVVGGDVAELPGTVAASLTLLGRAARRPVGRAGARAGDWIYVTGMLGRSVATGHHFRFAPRLAEGQWLARQRDVVAMMDVSDGIAKDLHAITPPNTAPAIDAARVPRRRGADLAAALAEGEDYELLFVLSRRASRATFEGRWRRAFPRLRLSCLGRFVRADRLPADCVPLERFHGYEHLR